MIICTKKKKKKILKNVKRSTTALQPHQVVPRIVHCLATSFLERSVRSQLILQIISRTHAHNNSSNVQPFLKCYHALLRTRLSNRPLIFPVVRRIDHSCGHLFYESIFDSSNRPVIRAVGPRIVHSFVQPFVTLIPATSFRSSSHSFVQSFVRLNLIRGIRNSSSRLKGDSFGIVRNQKQHVKNVKRKTTALHPRNHRAIIEDVTATA